LLFIYFRRQGEIKNIALRKLFCRANQGESHERSSKLPAYAGTTYPLQGYAIYRINKVVTPQNVSKERRQAEQQQLSQITAQQEMAAYINLLKKKYKVEMLKQPEKPAEPAAADEKK
jgi:peptidyl-prolyl cis-trans isomerase D